MGTLCSSGAALHKAGQKRTASGAALAEEFIMQAEAVISTETRYNWSGAYAALSKDVRKILEDAVSNLAGVYIINYDMSNYSSRAEAETCLDVLWASLQRDIKLLEDIKVKDFLEGV